MARRNNRRQFLKTSAGVFVPACFGIVRAQDIFPGPIMRTIASGAVDVTTNLSSYWHLDESSAGSSAVTRNDSQAGAQNLTDLSPFAASTTGLISNGVLFEVSAGLCLDHADSATLHMGDIDFTIQAWVKLTTKVAGMGIVTKYDFNNNKREYSINWNSTSDRYLFQLSSDGTSGTVHTATADNFGAPGTGAWHHIICTYNATTDIAAITINAGTANTVSHAGGTFNSDEAFALGAYRIGVTTASYLDGVMDEVAIWKNRVLNATEIAYLYNSGAGRLIA